ncbi:MAG: cryptochrome/photolyase family protein [Candidatus Velthaea sp.]
MTIWVTADQCTPHNTALAAADRASAVVLMIESIQRLQQTPYHKRKLVLIYAVMRHFAEELRAAGWTVDYHAEPGDFAAALDRHVKTYRPAALRMMQQSEWGVTERMQAAAQLAGISDTIVTPHANFISEPADFDRLAKTGSTRVTMENFYRSMRKKTGLLMDGGAPAGGAWNYDAQNRHKPKAGLTFPEPPRFEPDAITRDVILMVERHFPHHPGAIGDFHIAVQRRDALAALEHFVRERLDTFGPWQDAMLAGNRAMSHSLLSAYINTGLLHPLEVCERAELAYRQGSARLSSVEGFIRQVIGWREYVWRVYWKQMPEYRERNALGADLPLPQFYWDGETQMFCLHEALADVHETAYAHHIQRLMILGNFALIAGFDPVETNDWFWAMFIDGYDWVMVPNVIGMTLHADGGYVGTKPYAASANYINGMSNYCKRCRYDPKKIEGDDACPFNALYWDFLARNDERFDRNMRMRLVMKNWQNRPDAWKTAVRRKAASIRRALREGTPL